MQMVMTKDGTKVKRGEKKKQCAWFTTYVTSSIVHLHIVNDRSGPMVPL